MKLRLVKPSQGVAWVRQGILVFRQQWLGFVGLFALMVMLGYMVTALPDPVGGMLFAAGMPVMSMGFLLATRRVLTGQRISPAVLFEAVQGPDAPRAEFLKLGGIYAALSLLVEALATSLGPDAEALRKAAQQAQQDPGAGMGATAWDFIGWRVGLMTPVTLLFWHAPALLLWARVPVSKALFFSAVATWRNIGAFVLYGLTWLGVALLVAMLTSVLVAMMPLAGVAHMLLVTAGMLLMSAVHASIYFSVVECFEPQPPLAQGMDDNGAPPR